MRTHLLRSLGVLFLAVGIMGFIFCVIGVLYSWIWQPRLEAVIDGNLVILESALQTTGDGMVAADIALDSTLASLNSLETTLEQVATLTGQSRPVIDNLATLTQKDLPDTIYSAQLSLVSAQEAAQVIDRILRAIAGIPLIGSSLSYNPDVAMHVAISEMVNDLGEIPGTLTQIGETVDSTDGNIVALQASLELIALDIGGVSDGLGRSKTVINQYADLIADLLARIQTWRTYLPGFLTGLSWLLAVLFFWLAVAQLSLITEGLRLWIIEPEASKTVQASVSDL